MLCLINKQDEGERDFIHLQADSIREELLIPDV